MSLETLSKALRCCLQATLVVGAVITLFLWRILRVYFSWYFTSDPVYYWACTVLLTACGLCSLYILWLLIGLLKTVNNRDPFVRSNVRGLNHIAISSFAISALCTALACFRATVLTFSTAYIFLIAGFCGVVLSGLFKRAVAYKTEIDLTV